jgi:hypothetical protein
MVAGIDDKPEGLSCTENCLTQEAKVNTLLGEKVFQFKLPAA